MYARILVAVDLAKPDRARQVLAQAQKLCDPDGIIRLLHILSDPVTLKLRATAMARLLALSGGTDSRILPVLRDGQVEAQIRALAENDRADLVMLASRLPGMAKFLHDTSATQLTRHSSTLVLVARTLTPERNPHHV